MFVYMQLYCCRIYKSTDRFLVYCQMQRGMTVDTLHRSHIYRDCDNLHGCHLGGHVQCYDRRIQLVSIRHLLLSIVNVTFCSEL